MNPFAWLGYLGGLGIAGWLTDSESENSFPWYVNALLTFLFVVGGITIALVTLTRFGVADAVTRFFAGYFQFVVDITRAIAKPVLEFLT